jgi:hypothetical protein
VVAEVEELEAEAEASEECHFGGGKGRGFGGIWRVEGLGVLGGNGMVGEGV